MAPSHYLSQCSRSLLTGPLRSNLIEILQFLHFHSRKCVYRCRLESDGHFVTPMLAVMGKSGDDMNNFHQNMHNWHNIMGPWVQTMSCFMWVQCLTYFAEFVIAIILTLSHDNLFNRLFRRRSMKISKLCITDLCEGNPSVTGGFPSQRASNTAKASMWWCVHDTNEDWMKSRMQVPASFIHTGP